MSIWRSTLCIYCLFTFLYFDGWRNNHFSWGKLFAENDGGLFLYVTSISKRNLFPALTPEQCFKDVLLYFILVNSSYVNLFGSGPSLKTGPKWYTQFSTKTLVTMDQLFIHHVGNQCLQIQDLSLRPLVRNVQLP